MYTPPSDSQVRDSNAHAMKIKLHITIHVTVTSMYSVYRKYTPKQRKSRSIEASNHTVSLTLLQREGPNNPGRTLVLQQRTEPHVLFWFKHPDVLVGDGSSMHRWSYDEKGNMSSGIRIACHRADL